MSKHWLFIRLLACLVFGTLLIGIPAAAQEICPAVENLAALTGACQESALDSACTADGTITPLDQLPSDGQPQVIRLNGVSGTLILTLVGSQINAYEQGEVGDGGPIEISNNAGYNINLRSGPDANSEVVGTFGFDKRLLADGQSVDGNWLRVLLDDGSLAWVSKKLVSSDPALADLPVVDPNSSGNVGHILTIERADSACVESPAGVFITAEGKATQRLTINDLPIAVTNGTIFMIVDKIGMTFYGLRGNSNLGDGEKQQNLAAGEVMNWSDKPAASDSLPGFPALDVLEALRITPEMCLVATLDTPLDAIAAPDDETVVTTLNVGISYPVNAQISADNAIWFRLTEAFGGGWISGDLVNTLGACDTLPDANTVEPAATDSASESVSTPDQVMYSYLSARLLGDPNKMQTLSCESWDSQALLQSQSFRAMRTELVDVTCSTVSQTGTDAVVHCNGYIQTEYNGDFRQWALGSYVMMKENGKWRMCGEAD